MKKIFILSIVILFSAVSFCQNIVSSQVPVEVKNSLDIRFPDLKEIKWKIENDTTYTAEFKINESATEAEFNKKGEWLSTEWEFPVNYTPQAIKDYIAKNYAKYKINEISLTDFPGDGKLYVVEISNKKSCENLYFSLKNEFNKTVNKKCNK